EEEGVRAEGPAGGPGRGGDVDAHRGAFVVPAAVTVGGAQPERVVAGVEVRIGDAPAAAEGDPFGIEALELVGEAVALGGGVVQGRELDAEDLVPEAERDLTDLVGGPAQR